MGICRKVQVVRTQGGRPVVFQEGQSHMFVFDDGKDLWVCRWCGTERTREEARGQRSQDV